MQNPKRAAIELDLRFVLQCSVVVVFQRIGQQADLLIQRAHVFEHCSRNTGAQQQITMLIARQTSKEMSRFPFVDKYLCIFCLVSNTLGKAAMVLVRVRKNNTSNVCKLYADS